MNAMEECLIKAEQTSDLLWGDVRQAHKKSVLANAVLELHLIVLVNEAASLHKKLVALREACASDEI